MKIQYHCQCPECNGITVCERDAKWPGELPQVHIPFSVQENSWKCKGCGIVWGLEVELTNLTKEWDAEKGDMPILEGSGDVGRVAATESGGLSIG